MSLLQSLSNLSEIQDFLNTKPISLVMFSSPTCKPCKVLEPIIVSAAAKYPDEFGFLHVEAQENNTTAFDFYGISTVPTLILFKFNNPVEYHSGFKHKEEIINWLAEMLV
jgi:thioredoxin-like negative regulator of GroEL